LQPDSAEAELRVHPVLIQVQAFARAGRQQQASRLAVGAEPKAPANFDRGEQTDQPRANAVAGGDRPCQLFLALFARRQVDHRPLLRLGGGLASLLEPFADPRHVPAIVLQQDVMRVQISLHALALLIVRGWSFMAICERSAAPRA